LKEKLKSPHAVIVYTVSIMILITFLSCHVRAGDVCDFLKRRNYRNIKINYSNYFYSSVTFDTGKVSVDAGVMNIYAKLYIVNKKIK
jgi:hypothetical protein